MGNDDARKAIIVIVLGVVLAFFAVLLAIDIWGA